MKETRGEGTRCPGLGACDGLGFMQSFVEREPSVLFLRLLRYCMEGDAQKGFSEVRITQNLQFPEQIDFLRSGPYRFSAALLHHGVGVKSGHYTAFCREGGGGRYRWYSDDALGSLLTWRQAQQFDFGGQRLGEVVYVLVYVRERFWGDRVGDGSETTPYVRDSQAVATAKEYFRQDKVSAEAGVDFGIGAESQGDGHCDS